MRVALAVCAPDPVFCEHPFAAFSIHEARPPLGLGSLAASLKEEGHQVWLFDQAVAGPTIARLADLIAGVDPEVVGFSCTSLNVGNTRQCLRYVRDRLPRARYVCGGIHASLRPAELLAFSRCDAVLAGEAEIVFPLYLAHQANHGRAKSPSLPGLWVRGHVPEQSAAVLESLIQPFPDRDTLCLTNYSNAGSLVLPEPCHSLFQSRGCPFVCKFCSKPHYHKRYRTRSINATLAEIDHLVTTHGAASLCFREDNFTADADHLASLCAAIRASYGDQLTWECESRADLPMAVLEAMYTAGCRGIWCGIETVVPRWQHWLGKRIAAPTTRTFYSACADLGIRTGALFLFGFPSQTAAELETDIDFAASLPTAWRYFQCLAVFPGSRLAIEPHCVYALTSDVQVSLTKGKGVVEMLELERTINTRIRVTQPSLGASDR